MPSGHVIAAEGNICRERREGRMMSLVIVACLAVWQSHCQEVRPEMPDTTLIGCTVLGQQVAQEWLADHPKWMLSRWRCEWNKPRERAA
jgi:hypothetical protein